MMDLADAMQIVLDLARKKELMTDLEKEACNIVEDFVVNELGDCYNL